MFARILMALKIESSFSRMRMKYRWTCWSRTTSLSMLWFRLYPQILIGFLLLHMLVVIEILDAWDNLHSISYSHHLPWVAIGDFNDILYVYEEMRGATPSILRMQEFRSCLTTVLLTLGLKVLNSHGQINTLMMFLSMRD